MGELRRAQPASRRARVPEAHAAPRRRSRLARYAGRLGVLAALVGVTVVIPVSQAALADTGIPSVFASHVALPSTLDALTATPPSQRPPAALVSAAGAAEKTEVTLEDVERVSRSSERVLIPGCSGERPASAENGRLSASALCTLFDGHTQLRSDAAVALAELNEAFVNRFGADLCLASGYRTLGQQAAVRAQKGGLAAAPGASNHGFGLAVDFCRRETTGARWTWLLENGPIFGYEVPGWARPGGNGPTEPWHWEFTEAVKADGNYFD